jgi:hypothetical protein
MVLELRRPMELEEGLFFGWLLVLSSMLFLLFILVVFMLSVICVCSNILFRLSDEDFVDDEERVVAVENIELLAELSGYDGR